MTKTSSTCRILTDFANKLDVEQNNKKKLLQNSQVQFWFIVAFVLLTIGSGIGWVVLYRRARRTITLE